MSGAAICVGLMELDEHEIGIEAQYHPAASWEAARHHAARALVIRQLLLVECREQGLLREAPKDERQAQQAIERLLERSLPPSLVDEGACRAFHAQRAESFKGPPLYDASHVLFAAPSDDAPSRDIARRRAEALLAELTSAPGLFARRARELSACPSAQNDGRLGQISPGETDPAFEAALRALEPGELSNVVETRSGFHLIRLEARAEAQALPFDVVYPKIRLYLEERELRAQLHQLVLSLAQKHGVRGFDLSAPPPAAPAAAPRRQGPRRLAVVQ